MAGKPKIFVSYAHLDEPDAPGEVKWLTYVLSHLRPAVKHGVFEFWIDRHMNGGAKWEAEIERNLRGCDIFVLLVSRHSMASNFIVDKEIAIARERLARGEELHVYPIVLTPTAKVATDKVSDFNLRPRDAKPLSGFSPHDRDQHMAEIANEIAALAAKIEAARGAPAAPAPVASGAPTFLPPSLVNLTKLPESGYKTLVGREVELALLYSAWADPNVNILSLIAEGGAGKTALVEEWLTRMRRDVYRDAEVVLGWSFYSQGSKERATSAEPFLQWAVEQLGLSVASNAATAKAEAIATALGQRRVLLILDGCEPLQHGPETAQSGQLKDPGLRMLLRRFAAEPPGSGHGLIVLSSRAEVADLGRWNASSAPVELVTHLSDAAGAELLRDNGAKGSDPELRAAAHDFGGHPLALTLLANYLRETQGGDIRRRDHIRALIANPDNKGHDHARRVMESIEKEWLAGKPLLRSIMFLVGLFDRPASADCLDTLRRTAIPGLTKPLAGLDEAEWRRAVTRLRDVRLLAPEDPATPGALDAHPLTREWFGERLRHTNPAAWKAAHGRLYEHLRDETNEGDPPPNVEALAPLYQAVAHGCRAGRYQEALHEVYWNRICRRDADGNLMFHSSRMLGAAGGDLAAISWFFETPYTTVVARLTEEDRSWVLGQASSKLAWTGRLRDAAPGLRAALRMAEDASDRRNAAIAAANLSATELALGEIAAATATAEKAVAHADRAEDPFLMLSHRTDLAEARAAAGRRAEAEALFADAEARQKAWQAHYPRLYSVQGLQFCDLLLLKGEFAAVRERATQTLSWAQTHKFRLAIALDTLSIGRARLGLALSAPDREAACEQARLAAGGLDDSVAALIDAGSTDEIPRGYLARAALRRSIADWPGAARDLDEVEEIAEPGPFKLFLCDMALERARLALWRFHGFAPLAGLLPGQPEQPAPDPAPAHLDEAKRQLVLARDYITTCGYHERDAELAELDAVLAGQRTPATLPPRV